MPTNAERLRQLDRRLAWRFRVGRKLGRTLYRAVGNEPSDEDHLIGMLDRADDAKDVAKLRNLLPELAAVVEAAEGDDGRCLLCSHERLEDHDTDCPIAALAAALDREGVQTMSDRKWMPDERRYAVVFTEQGATPKLTEADGTVHYAGLDDLRAPAS